MDKARLNPEQQSAVSHINGPMLVVAGPGSGKTFLLIERIFNLIENNVKPEEILVITFSKKAALEMQGRFKRRNCSCSNNVTFGTFHAVFFHILQFYGIYNHDSLLKMKEKKRLVEEVGISLCISDAVESTWQESILEKISYYKNMGESTYNDNLLMFTDNNEKEEFLKIYERYSFLCKSKKKLDFDDMVTKCLDLFQGNQDIKHFWRQKYRYILVDEFQDINPAQYEMLKILEGDNHNLFVVGDDDQSIYGFRGSSPDIMQRFLDEHVGCKTVFLKLNYRCCYRVVEAADKCIRHNKKRLDRKCQQTLKNRKPGDVIVNIFDNEEMEADYIYSEIKKLLCNPVGDIAIIYRSEHCVPLIEEKLKYSSIKYEKNAPSINFYELESVSKLVSYIKVAINRGTRHDFLNILNHPDRDLSRNSVQGSDKSYKELIKSTIDFYLNQINLRPDDIRIKNLNKMMNDFEMFKDLPPVAAFHYILKGIGLLKDLEENYKRISSYPLSLEEILTELVNRMSRFETLEGFINYVDEICNEELESCQESKKQSMENNEQKIKITFITAHASKGLEYPVVFIAGLQEGLFPHRRNINEPGIEEERRLFYVAITRAKERLYLCGRGSKHGKQPSRFISEACDFSLS